MLTKRQMPESQFDAEITRVLKELSQAKPETEEYDKLIETLTKLHKLRTEDHSLVPQSKQVSPDTVLVVAANIFGILWLARYERENVIKSKSALPFVMKPR